MIEQHHENGFVEKLDSGGLGRDVGARRPIKYYVQGVAHDQELELKVRLAWEEHWQEHEQHSLEHKYWVVKEAVFRSIQTYSNVHLPNFVLGLLKFENLPLTPERD